MSGDSLLISREEQGGARSLLLTQAPPEDALSTSQSHGYSGTHSQWVMGALSKEAVCCPQRRESHFLSPQLYPVRNQSLAQQPLSLTVNRKRPGADSPRALASRRADSCLRSSSVSPGGDDGPVGAQRPQSKVTAPKSDLSVAMGTLGMPPPPVSGGREGKCEGTAADDAPGCWGGLPPNVCCQISSKQVGQRTPGGWGALLAPWCVSACSGHGREVFMRPPRGAAFSSPPGPS